MRQFWSAILIIALSIISVNTKGVTPQKEDDANSKPILVMLGAEWCTSCRSMKNHVLKEPLVEEIMEDFKFVYIDMDGADAPMVVAKFREHGYKGGIPYFVIMKQNGEIVKKLHGVRTAEEFCKFLISRDTTSTEKQP